MPRKSKTVAATLDRNAWTIPPPDHPDLAHIIPDLQLLAIPVDALVKLPGNYHQGDVGVVTESISQFNQRKPIVVNAQSGHVEAGNTTLDAVVAAGHRWIAAVLVEDDPATEKAYALVDNRAQQLGFDDPAALAAMLIELETERPDLVFSTGYDGDDLDALLRDLDIRLGEVEGEEVSFGAGAPLGHGQPAEGQPVGTVTIVISVPKPLRRELVNRLTELMNETQTLTMGEALVAHFGLEVIDG